MGHGWSLATHRHKLWVSTELTIGNKRFDLRSRTVEGLRTKVKEKVRNNLEPAVREVLLDSLNHHLSVLEEKNK